MTTPTNGTTTKAQMTSRGLAPMLSISIGRNNPPVAGQPRWVLAITPWPEIKRGVITLYHVETVQDERRYQIIVRTRTRLDGNNMEWGSCAFGIDISKSEYINRLISTVQPCPPAQWMLEVMNTLEDHGLVVPSEQGMRGELRKECQRSRSASIREGFPDSNGVSPVSNHGSPNPMVKKEGSSSPMAGTSQSRSASLSPNANGDLGNGSPRNADLTNNGRQQYWDPVKSSGTHRQ